MQKPEMIFDAEKVTLIMRIHEQSVVSHSIQEYADREGLLFKEEFHITLIGRATGEMIAEQISEYEPEERSAIIERIKELHESYEWKYSFEQVYYFIAKEYPQEGATSEIRKSIIQMIDLPDLEPFYQSLCDLLGVQIRVPLPHVTLLTTFTNGRLWGIGIYSVEQFEELCPELSAVHD